MMLAEQVLVNSSSQYALFSISRHVFYLPFLLWIHMCLTFRMTFDSWERGFRGLSILLIQNLGIFM